MEIESRRIEARIKKKVCQEKVFTRVFTMVGPKLSSCQFQRNVQKHLFPKKGLYTTVEDNEEIHELVMVAVAQHMNLLTALFTKEINRGIWCKARSRKFWRTCRTNWENNDYLNNVRVDSKTFWYLVDKLRPFLERQKTNVRPEPLEVDEIIAIVLWRLGDGDSMAS